MAKASRKQKPSSSKKLGTKIFGNKSAGILQVQKYSFSNIEGLEPLESYDNIVKLTVLCMVTVVLLVQLRIIKPDTSGSSLDRSPSFRFYKKKCLLADPGYATAVALAAGLPELIIFLPDDPEELVAFLTKTLDSYVGNEKFIEVPTQGNIIECLWGHISRICGFLNSCPAANMSLFNLSAAAAELSIGDVIKMIPIQAAQSLSPREVAESLKVLFSTKDENGNYVPPTFEEVPLSGPVAVDGCSKIEAEIFGDDLPIRKLGSGKSISGPSSSSKVTLAEAEQHLDPLQLRKYRAALELGKTSLISKYEKIIVEKQYPISEPSSSSSRSRNRSKSSPTASQSVED
jgi:hypothetical protein